MTDEPKKTVEDLVEKLVEQDLASSTEERAEALEAEGVDIGATAAKARAAIGKAIDIADKAAVQTSKRGGKGRRLLQTRQILCRNWSLPSMQDME